MISADKTSLDVTRHLGASHPTPRPFHGVKPAASCCCVPRKCPSVGTLPVTISTGN